MQLKAALTLMLAAMALANPAPEPAEQGASAAAVSQEGQFPQDAQGMQAPQDGQDSDYWPGGGWGGDRWGGGGWGCGWDYQRCARRCRYRGGAWCYSRCRRWYCDGRW